MTFTCHDNIFITLTLQDTTPGAPSVEAALVPLRAYLYRILLPRHEQHVTEYGRSPYENMHITEVGNM